MIDILLANVLFNTTSTKRVMARNISPEEYLAQHNILTYVEDAIAQLLVYKDDAPKVDINRFFAQYFQCLKDGNHTMLREYSFIKSTPYNRACFIKLFYKCFAVMGKKGDLLSIRDYYALVSMLCNDFPYEILQKTAKIVLIDDAHDCLISFTDFLYAFQIQLYYQEFLELSSHTYQVLCESQSHSPRDIVVPTDHTSEHKSEAKLSSTIQSGDGVDSSKFYRLLSQLPDKHKCCMPPLPTLKDVLSTTEYVTFYGFLVALSKSQAINSSIGQIPSSENIFDGVELNLNEELSICTPKVSEHQNDKSLSKQTTPRHNTPMKKKEVKPLPRRQRALRSLRQSKAGSSDSDSSADSSDTDT